MTMSKKDYVMLANTIRTSTQFKSDNAREIFARHLCIGLEADNPRFNKDVFVAAATDPFPDSTNLVDERAWELNEAAVARRKA